MVNLSFVLFSNFGASRPAYAELRTGRQESAIKTTKSHITQTVIAILIDNSSKIK